MFRKTVKKLVKALVYTTLGFSLLVCVYLLAAFILSRITIDKEKDNGKDISMYILSNGVHVDLVVPVRTSIIDWSNDIKFENTLGKDTSMTYVAFGWGDKGFYLETPTWDDLTLKTACKAAFGLGTSAIHATFCKSLKEDDDCKKLGISNEQYTRLVAYIKNSFDRDSTDQLIHINTNAVYGLYDAFYEAKGSYNLFYTCNTWANSGLKSCGQKASLWTPFCNGIFYQYK